MATTTTISRSKVAAAIMPPLTFDGNYHVWQVTSFQWAHVSAHTDEKAAEAKAAAIQSGGAAFVRVAY